MTNEEAIKIIDKGLDIGVQMPFLTVDQMNEAKQMAIKALSEQRTGHWISSPNNCFAHCSECGLHGDKGIYKHYKYCPNCGAKMEENS